MQKYIFGERNGIYIIDLQKTLKKFREAYAFIRELAAGGGTVLFVGTKKQAQETVFDEASRCGMLHHRSPENAEEVPRGLRLHPGAGRWRGHGAVRGHQEAGPGDRLRRGLPLRHVTSSISRKR